MKTLIQISLLLLLVGCATPYNPVSVSGGGNYYLAERAGNGLYYGTHSAMFTDIGVYPWWAGGYRPRTLAYYSPNFYPHYFSVWYPPGYHPYYGYYGGYYAYWCPPYRIRRHHGNLSGEGIAGSPVLPPVAYSGQLPADPQLWRSIDRIAVNREMMKRGTRGQKAGLPARSASAYPGSQTSSLSAAQMGSVRPAGFNRSSTRSVSSSRGKSVFDRSPARHKQ
jgi:hypothetical protein